IGNQLIDVGLTLNLSIAATDPGGGSVTYSLDPGAPAGAGINPQTGLFSWTPGFDKGPGVYSVTVRASDTGTPGLTTSQTFDIHVSAAPASRLLVTAPSEVATGASFA